MKTQDKELAITISVTLRTGILLAVTCASIGSALYLWQTGMSRTSFAAFQGSSVPFTSVMRVGSMVVRPASMQERGLGIAEVGVLILMVTPLLRVVFSLIGFLRSGDKLFVGITLVVLSTLVGSILIH